MNKDTLIIDNKYFRGYEEINNCLLANDMNYLIEEDYEYWNSNNRNKNNGKMLIHSDNHIQYFFDDNDCVYYINKHKDNLQLTNFFHINSLDARLDEDYYINIIS